MGLSSFQKAQTLRQGRACREWKIIKSLAFWVSVSSISPHSQLTEIVVVLGIAFRLSRLVLKANDFSSGFLYPSSPIPLSKVCT